MRPNIESHSYSRSSNYEQRIFNDSAIGEIEMHADFEFKGDALKKGHFTLRNRQSGNRKFSLDTITYCRKLKTINANLSIVAFNSRDYYRVNDVEFSGMDWAIGSTINFQVTFKVNEIENPITDGEDCLSIKPDDKDGSILIGTQ